MNSPAVIRAICSLCDSHSDVAQRCVAGEITACGIRESLTVSKTQSEDQPRTYQTKHGNTAQIGTASLSKLADGGNIWLKSGENSRFRKAFPIR